MVLLLLAALFVLRYDFWWWAEPRLVFGLPIGLTYHIAFCFAVTGVMSLVVRFAWPLDDAAETEPEKEDGVRS
ncbi:MAG: hypothetical protein AAGA81_19315 [Acidobacteriota bacterium]